MHADESSVKEDMNERTLQQGLTATALEETMPDGQGAVSDARGCDSCAQCGSRASMRKAKQCCMTSSTKLSGDGR